MPSHFQDNAIQNQPFSTNFSVAILSVLLQKINFEKANLHLLKQLISKC